MRIGIAWEKANNVHYRVIIPMRALARRGHEIVWPADLEGDLDLRRVAHCDVVHVYRRSDKATRLIVSELCRSGRAVNWDNDDDYRTVPEGHPRYRDLKGLAGQRIFQRQMRVAKIAGSITTPSPFLAESYRQASGARVEVIENYLSPEIRRPRRRHGGLVIGWVAGTEHRTDVARIGIRRALERVLAENDDVRVECIGVDLGLPVRYRHDRHVDFPELPKRIGGFDIGIAPLADVPFNRARSSIKVKEYAASGVPWLASPVGPYATLTEAEGGRLVQDEGWYEALTQLVRHRRDRRALGRQARAWARTQLIDAATDRWEKVLVASAAAKRREASVGFASAGQAR
jgi:glycosyltransferase involved in cell wall biosynthesis